MPSTTSILEQIQECVYHTLSGLPDFATSGVLYRARGDISSTIEEALNRLGMSIVVLPLVPTVARPDVPGPHFDVISIQIHCVTIPTTNTTGLTALEAAEIVLIALHHANYTLDDGQHCLLNAARSAIAPQDGEGLDFVVVNLETSATLRPRNS